MQASLYGFRYNVPPYALSGSRVFMGEYEVPHPGPFLLVRVSPLEKVFEAVVELSGRPGHRAWDVLVNVPRLDYEAPLPIVFFDVVHVEDYGPVE